MSIEDDDWEQDRQGDLATATEKPKLQRPPMYKVLLLNDDFTPMEFVVHVLEVFFAMNREKATQIMLAVHTTGGVRFVGYFREMSPSQSRSRLIITLRKTSIPCCRP